MLNAAPAEHPRIATGQPEISYRNFGKLAQELCILSGYDSWQPGIEQLRTET
jgi:hypothetical protein